MLSSSLVETLSSKALRCRQQDEDEHEQGNMFYLLPKVTNWKTLTPSALLSNPSHQHENGDDEIYNVEEDDKFTAGSTITFNLEVYWFDPTTNGLSLMNYETSRSIQADQQVNSSVDDNDG